MTDNGDGTYSHNFTVENAGPISIYIYSAMNNSINATVYTGRNFDSTPLYQNWTEIYRRTGSLNSGYFSSYFRSPTCAPITISYDFHDGIRVRIDGVQRHNNLGSYGGRNSTILNSEVGKFHLFQLDWRHFYLDNGYLYVKMSYGQQTCNNTVVPGFSNSSITGAYWYSLAPMNPSTSLPYDITVSTLVVPPVVVVPEDCEAGYEWNNSTQSCEAIYGFCFPGYVWSNTTLS